MGWLRNRVKEPSSWAGLGALITAGAQAYGQGGKTALIATILAGVAAVALPEQPKQ